MSGSTQLNRCFDSVIMLTASNWKTEPRSNRYHYATRFAKSLPVYFVQFDNDTGEFDCEPSEIEGLTLVHAARRLIGQVAADRLNPDLAHRFGLNFDRLGCERPLVWIYDPRSHPLLEELRAQLTVYHATENYIAREEGFFIGTIAEEYQTHLSSCTKILLSRVDLVIAVAQGVYEALLETGLTRGLLFEVRNGCDYAFWQASTAHTFQPSESGRPIALYQGGINFRIDFPLVRAVIDRLPDWDFWFCGPEDEMQPGWTNIKQLPNVRYFGKVEPQEIAALAKRSTLGWVPFLDFHVLKTSMPLKMYEYVACGLPVVSTPIAGLIDEDPRLFTFGTSADAFVDAFATLAATRTDPQCLALRDAAAARNSYETRFDLASDLIAQALEESCDKRKNILILYDDNFSYIKTIEEHLKSFERHSQNNIYYLPANAYAWQVEDDSYFPGDQAHDLDLGRGSIWDLRKFDVVIIHYAVRLSLERYFSPAVIRLLKEFGGKKILFIQDEYDGINHTWDNIEKIGVDTIFTCVPEENWRYIYPQSKFPALKFVKTLTGYVPEAQGLERHARPIHERRTLIGYRGRRLPHHYGMLGYEKFVIGERVRAAADRAGLPVDIETEDSKRIYGSWYSFLGRCRATLGTESGCNIFDFDDSLRQKALKLSDRSFEEVYDEHFKPFEGPVRMNQVSPKFFEAIRLRTALVCFPGDYSGILKPGDHYIVLEKDFSNIDEVFEKIQDDKYIQKLTDRAYKDIIESGRYSYRSFIASFDQWLAEQVPYARCEIISSPIAVRTTTTTKPILKSDRRATVMNDAVLGGRFKRTEFAALFPPSTVPEPRNELPPAPPPAIDDPIPELAQALPLGPVVLGASQAGFLARPRPALLTRLLRREQSRNLRLMRVGGFDAAFYRATYRDVREAGVDPLDHYLAIGWQEGRNPNATFQPQGYLDANRDINPAIVNPLLHFWRYGLAEGRQGWRALAAPDRTRHAIGRREAAEVQMPLGGFDPDFYRRTYPDIAASDIDPLAHFLTHGWLEGRDPCAHFSTSGYLAENIDVKRSRMNPLAHFWLYGLGEGRTGWEIR